MPEIADVRPELVFTGGTVLTGDPSRPVTDAVAVAGGRIVALSGVIAAGRRADLCLVGADLAGVEDGVAGVPVVGTWLAGTEVFAC
jgi:predicted amidohydrolase YtcJ